jgi:RNA polymerase sigma factor (sigma-70 family)
MTRAYLTSIFGTGTSLLRADPRSDAELLARFLQQGDERAFQALLVRHTPAVRAACQGWLRSEADIDDAAQATFLVLVQRGRSLRNPASLGPWLYRIAENVARRLRLQQSRFHPLAAEIPGRESTEDGHLRQLLAEEVARLPEKYRLPVQLCYSAGLSTAEAAQRLGWPRGTVLTRLAWARQRLQKNLTRRGVAPGVIAGLSLPLAQEASVGWLQATSQAAKAVLTGEVLVGVGVSARTVSLTEGVIRAMTVDRLKYIVLATLIVVGLAGLGLRQWASATAGPGDKRSTVATESDHRDPLPVGADLKDKGKAEEARPGPMVRRREAVIRLPSGSFVKEVSAMPYGTGRITWTYEEERVVGLIEGSVMGVEFEVATEAEYALSSNGTIYGLVTSLRVEHLRFPETGAISGRSHLPLQEILGLWSAFEPVVTEMTTDLPFSYRFRVQGDRLIISNFRILLAGPNPLGKLGGVMAGKDKDGLEVLAYFQALGTALEGTYLSTEAKEKLSAPGKRPLFMKPREGVRGKPSK